MSSVGRRRYRYDKTTGKMVQVPLGGPGSHNTIVDAYAKNPVKSPVDGSVLDSRAKLREHNARLNVVDVGNDGIAQRESRPDVNPTKGLRRDLERAYAEIDVCR